MEATTTGLATAEQTELRDRLTQAERTAVDEAANAERHRRQANTMKSQLATARVRIGQLERQMQGYDEDLHDPQKQKGLGGIPIGGDFREIEAIEKKLGMAPTMDEQMRSLGMASPEEATQRLLTQEGEVQYAEVVAEADERGQLATILQALWKARHVLRDAHLTDAVREAAAAVDALPASLFTKHLDLEDWDERGLPPIKEH